MTPRQKVILQFENRWYTAQGNKEADITDRFEFSAVSCYQLLAPLLDDPEALAADPVLAKRLRRIRDSRAKLRSAGLRQRSSPTRRRSASATEFATGHPRVGRPTGPGSPRRKLPSRLLRTSRSKDWGSSLPHPKAR